MSSVSSGRIARWARVTGGACLIVCGLPLLVLPGPGIPLFLAGLLLLEREFDWARSLRQWLVMRVTSGTSFLLRVWRYALDRAGYSLALLPLLTDWVDAGHWPRHPRELVTEVVIGGLILLGVHGLYRRADRFRALAETDALTGLGNRARFRADLRAAVSQARATHQPLALAYIDVDGFKAVNDRFGHQTGDEVLRDVARTLERSVRQSADGCYRLGGDEFAVLVSNADVDSALEAVRRGFERSAPSTRVPISCSVGVTLLTGSECENELVARADRLMYSAKQGAHKIAGARLDSCGKVSWPATSAQC